MMEEKTIHVDGSTAESGDGTVEAAFRTIPEALAAAARRASPATVALHAGVYNLPEPIRTDSALSGTTLTRWGSDRVTISGGVPLDCQWTPYRDGILQCPLPADTPQFTQLFVEGERMIRARYPNYDPSGEKFAGYTKPTGIIGEDVVSPCPDPDEDMTFAHTPARGICFDPADITRRWQEPETGVIHIFQAHGWGNLQWELKCVDWDENRMWFGDGGYQMGAQWCNDPCAVRTRSHFFVENIFEELDAPGEWYLDEETKVLYFYPPAHVDPATAAIEGSRLKTLVVIKGTQKEPVRNVSIRGIRFAHADVTYLDEYDIPSLGDWSIVRNGAVFLEGTRDCSVRDCMFDALGGNAVFVNNYNRSAGISGNTFQYLGESAICFVGDHYKTIGTRRAFPYECRAENNLVHHCGVFGKQVAGVYLSRTKRITVGHNTIHTMPRAGICIGDGTWGGHVIEFNHVYDTCLETGDHGPFNAWGRERDWCRIQAMHGDPTREVCHHAGDIYVDAMETVVVRNNFFRETAGWGLDLDDGASNYEIYNNLCVGVTMKLREGAQRTIYNNIWVHGANSVCFHVGNTNNGDRYFNNITVMTTAGANPENDLHFAMGESFGELYTLIFPPPTGPMMEEVDRNCFYNDIGEFVARIRHRPQGGKPIEAAKYSLEEWQALGFDQNSVFADPLFVDPDNDDYRVREDSPALTVGFKNFEMGQWGITPEFRHFERS